MANMIDAINYVSANKLEAEANKIANKVGDIYMACVMLYQNIPQTEKNIITCKKIVADRKKRDCKAWNDFLNGEWENSK